MGTTIERKTTFNWTALKATAEANHWKKLRVAIQIRDRLHAGKPAQLDAANAMLAARGLGDVVEAREQARPDEERAEEVVEEGLCEFHRRDGKPGIWLPSNNVKACLKENASVLGYRMDATPPSKRKEKDVDEDGKATPRKKLQGLRGAMHEGVFVCGTEADDRDWLYLGTEPAGIHQAVAHTTGPKGPRASIKRNEYVERVRIVFEVWIARAIADKIPDETLADVLLHAQEHGIGANRSQGYGRFDVVSVDEL
ncbi:MAG: hypothetical protein Q8S13_00560 [Dehalococcoidia bacterium]|nr:hypothetical protein [Dehalococcoidia bacterium]